MQHLLAQLQVIGVMALTKFTALKLQDYHTLASIFALCCGAVASLSIAYWHFVKKPKPIEQKVEQPLPPKS